MVAAGFAKCGTPKGRALLCDACERDWQAEPRAKIVQMLRKKIMKAQLAVLAARRRGGR